LFISILLSVGIRALAGFAAKEVVEAIAKLGQQTAGYGEEHSQPQKNDGHVAEGVEFARAVVGAGAQDALVVVDLVPHAERPESAHD